jgi:hypothetical protein
MQKDPHKFFQKYPIFLDFLHFPYGSVWWGKPCAARDSEGLRLAKILKVVLVLVQSFGQPPLIKEADVLITPHIKSPVKVLDNQSGSRSGSGSDATEEGQLAFDSMIRPALCRQAFTVRFPTVQG